MKIVESEDYIILEEVDIEELMEVVNLYIKEGYKPQGGVFHYKNENKIIYAEKFCQAMFREREKEGI